jgi:metal-responsive CopG/Arc/MetJ family transcriptional regulator
MKVKKLSMLVSEDLIKKIDVLKEKMGIKSRADMVSMILYQYVEQRGALEVLPELIKKVDELEKMKEIQK